MAAVLGAAPVQAASPEPSPDAFDATLREVAGDRAPAEADIHQVWAQIMAASSDDRHHSYVAPSAVAAYSGGEVPDTPCALATNVRFWRANARYCGQDSTIWFDESWLRELAGLFGGFAPAAVLAHEWGHHIQTFGDAVPPGLRSELQADCFAGMYLGETEGLEPDGTYVDRLDEFSTALFSFFSLGDSDYQHSQWFQPGVHGSSQQRILAFTTGYLTKSLDRGDLRGAVNGFDWCLGYSDYEPTELVEVGPYRLLEIPGRQGTWADGTYVIEPRPEAVFASSQLRLRWFDAHEPIERATDELLAGRIDEWLPGSQVQPLGTLAVRTGSGVAGNLVGPDEHGIAALAVPVTGDGGLLIVASRSSPAGPSMDAIEDMAIFMEQVIAISQVVARLCEPGETPGPTLDNHNAVCDPELQ